MKKKGMNRREFLSMMALGTAGVAMGPARSFAAMGMGMVGGSTSVIDPPVGGLFRNPPELAMTKMASLTGGLVEVNLEAKIAPVTINGSKVNLMTYNGSFPGPTIRVRKGDTLKINITNNLPATNQTNLLGYPKYETNLHTHGFHVSPVAPSDYVMYKLKPGQTYNHVYETSLVAPGAFNFYHPHKHGVSAEQYWAGLVGALIVEDENDLLAGYETHIMVLKDISVSSGAPAPHSMMSDFMHGKEGNIVMVNGQVNPRLNIKTGQVQRWRIVNASNARFYRLSLEGHQIHIIGTDGGLLDKPYPLSEVLLSPGERVDLLVKGTQTVGNFRLLALPYARRGMMSSQTVTLLTTSYNGTLEQEQSLPTVVSNVERLDPTQLPIMAERAISLSMGQMNAYINGQDFDVNPYTIHSMLGSYEIWTIYNDSGMDHPFHQHVNAAQVLAVNGGDAGYASLYTKIPAWKDTVLVPKWGSVKMLVPVMDFMGMAMFHCHILEHEDIGMMGVWDIM